MNLKQDRNGNIIQGVAEPRVAQKVSLTTASAANTTEFTNEIIRIYSEVDCFFKIGSGSVAATVNDHFLPAKTIEFLWVGSNTKIAAILASGTGNMYISEMA